MKIGFSKDGLKINSKEFNPLNIPIKGFSLESDIPVKQPDAAELLSVFQQPNIRKANRMQGIEILKAMIEKAR